MCDTFPSFPVVSIDCFISTTRKSHTPDNAASSRAFADLQSPFLYDEAPMGKVKLH